MQMFTKIFIPDISVSCIIGVKPEERVESQPVRISVALWADVTRAGMSDDIGDTVDYGALCRAITAETEYSSYHLLEALAEHISQVCLRDPRVKKARVMVKKPRALKSAQYAAVEIMRMRSDHA